MTDQTGIDFVHVSGNSPDKPFPAANGSGVAAFDYDLDGSCDLLFLTLREFPPTAASATRGNQMYRNVGDWEFANVTEATGLGHKGYSAGPAVGDFNSDGFPDLYVNCYGPNQLYLNQGDGTFRECAAGAGVDDPSFGTSCAFFDFDGDADLDLYVCNYGEWTWEANPFCGNRQKNARIFCAPRSIKPAPDRLYENLGDGRFRDALEAAGLAREPGRAQGIVAADLDQDGLLDLYIGNDANPNFLFRNRGDGTFEDLTEASGAAADLSGRFQAGMGVDAADIDRDGLLEVFVTNYEDEQNAFYRNLGENVFQDESRSQGLAAPSMRWVGWGTSFTDFDLDGWVDLVVTNGHTDDNLHELGREAPYAQPPLLFRNENGWLQPVHEAAGSYFAAAHPGRSLCAADLDRDGDADMAIGHQDQPAAVLRNDSLRASGPRVLSLKLVATTSNREGIGAQIEALLESPPSGDPRANPAVQMKSGGSYLASMPHEATLSLPNDADIELEVRWPSGRVERLPAPAASGRYVLLEGGGLVVLARGAVAAGRAMRFDVE
ncbi:MAG: CRTAC1 family protein [Planctomycetes bacterium]|nr:CRTAC1 family protein [Planctomycetota bacterium]